MEEKIDLNEFDILGIIRLKDIKGIEKYVTPIIEEGIKTDYLSRSKEYYNVKSMSELAIERENLAKLLTQEFSKKNFVIVENMLNCSGKVYFKKFQQYISSMKNEKLKMQLKQAEDCLIEDVTNIITLLQNRGTIQVNFSNRLPGGDENSEKRPIEMDNKALLYLFTKALSLTAKREKIEILIPGYGSLYIGPFFKVMYGYDYTNTFKSKYIEDTMNTQNITIRDLMSSDRPFENGKTILLIDDNIGTGTTMKELKRDLQKEGVANIISGAVQYNWRNYYRVSIGEKTDIEKFNVNDFDIVTPFNYAGHKLYKRSIDLLHSSGSEYIKYLNYKTYREKICSDIKGAVIRGVTCSQRVGLKLADGLEEYVVPEEITGKSGSVLEKYKNDANEISNPISQEIIRRIIFEVRKLEELEMQMYNEEERL